MASLIDLPLQQRWQLRDLSLTSAPPLEACASAEKGLPRCETGCMLQLDKTGKRHKLPNNVSLDICSRCECSLCFVCAKPLNSWLSPDGQALASVTTMTRPPFQFAYNPYDHDMHKMRRNLVLEPVLTHAWYEQTARCCREPGALVVDVGGNYGWYTLYSVALGCSVVVFEPVPAYQEVLRLGLALNPGFASNVKLYGNVVYDEPGIYTLRVPKPSRKRAFTLGMTGMAGKEGLLKTPWNAPSYDHNATAVRVDDLVDRDVCMLKVDVEGYEPQVMQTAQRLLAKHSVATLQMELTRTKSPNQTCAAIRMLEHLDVLGYEFKQVAHLRVGDQSTLQTFTWETSTHVWDSLPPFPSPRALDSFRKRSAGVTRLKGSPRPLRSRMEAAYKVDFVHFSTNLIGVLRAERKPKVPPPFPPLYC